jgi:hypothetical protein
MVPSRLLFLCLHVVPYPIVVGFQLEGFWTEEVEELRAASKAQFDARLFQSRLQIAGRQVDRDDRVIAIDRLRTAITSYGRVSHLGSSPRRTMRRCV